MLQDNQFQAEYELNDLVFAVRNYIIEEAVTKKSIEEFSGKMPKQQFLLSHILYKVEL